MSDHLKMSDWSASAEINSDKSLNKVKVDCWLLNQVMRTIIASNVWPSSIKCHKNKVEPVLYSHSCCFSMIIHDNKRDMISILVVLQKINFMFNEVTIHVLDVVHGVNLLLSYWWFWNECAINRGGESSPQIGFSVSLMDSSRGTTRITICRV